MALEASPLFERKDKMNNKELIEKLKNKEQARHAGWLQKYRPKEYKLLADAGPENRLRLNCRQRWVRDIGGIDYIDCLILNPDYQSKPEYVSFEIVDLGGYLRLREYPGGPPTINSIVAMKNFYCFFVNEDDCVKLENIATLIRSGHKVYARFLKEYS